MGLPPCSLVQLEGFALIAFMNARLLCCCQLVGDVRWGLQLPVCAGLPSQSLHNASLMVEAELQATPFC